MEYRHYLTKVKISDLEKLKSLSLNDVSEHIKTDFDYMDREYSFILLDDIIEDEIVFKFGNMFNDDSGLIEYANEIGKQVIKDQKFEELLSTYDHRAIDNDTFAKIIQFCEKNKPDLFPGLVKLLNEINWNEYNLMLFGLCWDF